VNLELAKRNARRIFEEAFTQGRLDTVDECLAPDAVDGHPLADDEPDFPTHMKAMITMLRAGLPDLRMTVEDLFGEGDRLAARVLLTGTHTGSPLFGVVAQGNAVRVEQFHIIAFDDHSRGVRHWADVGIDDVIKQLSAAA
jgi:predicted ester cyclase